MKHALLCALFLCGCGPQLDAAALRDRAAHEIDTLGAVARDCAPSLLTAVQSAVHGGSDGWLDFALAADQCARVAIRDEFDAHRAAHTAPTAGELERASAVLGRLAHLHGEIVSPCPRPLVCRALPSDECRGPYGERCPSGYCCADPPAGELPPDARRSTGGRS